MKTRMSVARCCCDGTPDPEIIQTLFREWIWDEQSLQYDEGFAQPGTFVLGREVRSGGSFPDIPIRRSGACSFALNATSVSICRLHLRNTQNNLNAFRTVGTVEVNSDPDPTAVTAQTAEDIDTWTTIAGQVDYDVAIGQLEVTLDITSLIQSLLLDAGWSSGNLVNVKMTTDPTMGQIDDDPLQLPWTGSYDNALPGEGSYIEVA